MRNLFGTHCVVLAGVVSLPLAISPRQTHFTPAPHYRNDTRLQAIRNFFGKTDCPAQNYSREFLEAADDYELDWRLLPSLSWVESTGGKAARGNNYFGWDSGRAEFTSPVAGIHAVGYWLANASQYRDKSLDEILATYNPDADYGRKVKSVMRQIAPSE